MINTKETLLKYLVDTATQFGVSFSEDVAEIADFTTREAVELAMMIGSPDFEEAQAISVESISLMAGIAAVEQADAADAKLRSIIQMGLSMLTRSILPVPMQAPEEGDPF